MRLARTPWDINGLMAKRDAEILCKSSSRKLGFAATEAYLASRRNFPTRLMIGYVTPDSPDQ
jgi:hypothetical protein